MLPVVAALLASGVPLAPVMVFLISSPLMSPSAFIITLGGLGPALATGKITAALIIGLAAGLVTHHLTRLGYLGRHTLKLKDDDYHSSSPSLGEPRSRSQVFQAFLRGTYGMTRMIGKYLLVALVLQVLLKRYVPAEWVEGILGSSQAWSVVLSSIIGVPLYVNGISAVPVLQGLLRMGMDPGAVLAFLVAGPVMTVPSVVAVMALVRRQALYVYVSVGLLGAIFMGYSYQLATGVF
ncbi:MAG: permease [Candidatus Omnitrophota bacterium]